MRFNRKRISVVAACLFAACAPALGQGAASSPASSPADDGPAWVIAKSGDPGSREHYGSDENVQLLAALLADKDPVIREQAVRNLGQTHNLSALPFLQKAAKDSEAIVRAAAMYAAAEFEMGDYGSILLVGLKDADKAVVVQACRAATWVAMTAAKDALAALLSREEPMVQSSALEALTAMKLPAPVADLQNLLKSPSAAVRLAALQNACLAEKPQAEKLVGAAGTIARKDTPGVREWALAFLGSYASNDGLLAEAMKDAQPLVRRGALRGYASAGKGEVMKDALKDPSPMVRLAAIRFAGQLKCQDAVAGLFEQLRSVEDELSHNAARESLGQIGTEPVAKSAAAMADEMWKQAHEEDAAAGAAAGVANEGGEKIKQLQTQVQKAQEAAAACDKAYQALAIAKPAAAKADVEAAKAKLTEAQKRLAEAQTALQDPSSRAAAAQDTSAAHIRQKGKCFRNMRSCHWLLGQLKSPEGFDLRMELLRLAVAGKSADFVQTDSPFLEEVSASLGRLGDARAIDPLNQLMAGIGKHAPGLSMMTPPPGFRYNPHVTVATMIALGQLKAPQRLVDMKAILDVRIMMSGRLNFESEIIMRIMPDLVTEQNRPTIEAMVGGVIRPEGAYDLLVRFQAVKTAVKVGLQKQVPAIRDMLVKERQDRNSMRVAAWALKKLTGEDLPIGEPQVLQGDWILRKR